MIIQFRYPLQFGARDQDCVLANGWDDGFYQDNDKGRCPEYSEIFQTGRVDETGQFGDLTQRGSTQVRWFGQDLSRAPDLGMGYTQDHRTQWANDGWVEPDSYRPLTHN